MTNRQQVARLESRKGADFSDMQSMCQALKEKGFQVVHNPSNGSIEVYKP